MLPKSKLGEALRNHWDALRLYLTDGLMPIDNNDGPQRLGTANVDWDQAQQSADRLAPPTQPANLGSAGDGLQPNRPAEIQSAESKSVRRKGGRAKP